MQVPNHISIFLAKHYRSIQKQSSGFLDNYSGNEKNTKKSLFFFSLTLLNCQLFRFSITFLTNFNKNCIRLELLNNNYLKLVFVLGRK